MKYLLFVFLISAVFYSCFLPRYAIPFAYDPEKAGADIVERIDGSKMKPVFEITNINYLYCYESITNNVFCGFGSILYDGKIHIYEYDSKTIETDNIYEIYVPTSDLYYSASYLIDFYVFGTTMYFMCMDATLSDFNMSLLRYDIDGSTDSLRRLDIDRNYIYPVCFKVNETVTELMFVRNQYFGEIDYDASGDVILKDFIYEGYNVSQIFSDKLLKINRGGYFVYFDPIGLRIFVNDSYYYEPESRYYHTMYIYHLSTGELKTVTLSYLLLTDYLRTRDVSGDEIWLNAPDSGDAVKIRLL